MSMSIMSPVTEFGSPQYQSTLRSLTIWDGGTPKSLATSSTAIPSRTRR